MELVELVLSLPSMLNGKNEVRSCGGHVPIIISKPSEYKDQTWFLRR